MNPRTIDQLEETAVQDTETAIQQTRGQTVHLLDLLIILSRRRKFILWFTLGVAILTMIIVLLVPNAYTAQTILLPPTQNSSMGSALLNQLTGGSSALASIAGADLGMKSPGDMYISLFRTQTVEDALIQRFGLMARYREKKMSDARRAFEEHSSVVLGVKDGLIRIAVTDRDPKTSAEIANAYVDEFRKLSAHLAITEASQRRAFFQQQLFEANENLASAEEAMKSTEQSTGVLQIDSQARALIQSAATLHGQIAEKEVELKAMRTYATQDNPQMSVAEEQLTELKAQLAELGGKDTNSSSDIIVPKGNIPAAQIQYIRAMRDVQYYQTIEEILAKQFEMAKLDEAREGSIIQVAEVAASPDRKSSPHRTLIVVLMTFIAFAIAAFWTLISNKWDSLQSDSEIRERVGMLRGLSFRRRAADARQ